MLVERYANLIYRVVYGVLQSAADAEDAAQEAFVQIHLSLPTYKRKGLKTWMSKIAVNKAIDYRRKAIRRKEQLSTIPAEQVLEWKQGVLPGTEDIVLHRERRSQITRNILDLPAHYREVVVAYYLEEKSYQQIAQELGLEVKSIESRLYRAKRWMRKHWKEDD